MKAAIVLVYALVFESQENVFKTSVLSVCPKSLKIDVFDYVRPKSLKIDVFDYPSVV